MPYTSHDSLHTGLSTVAPNCLHEAYTFDIRIFFNDRGTEPWPGGKGTDMTCATKDLWT
jgi:hypothetical protein